MHLELSDRQQSTVAAALTILAACVILVAIGALFWMLALFVGRFSNVILPLAVAAVAAMVFKPYFDWLHGRLRLPRVLAIVAVFLSMIVPLVACGWFFGAIIVDQVGDLVDRLPGYWQSLVAAIKQHAPAVAEFIHRNPAIAGLTGAVQGGQESLVQGLQAVGSRALSAGWNALSAVASLLAWAVVPVYFAFFLLVEPRFGELASYLPFLKSNTRDDVVYLVEEFVSIIVAFFRGQLIIAFLQGTMFALGFSLVGLHYGFVIGLVLGFLNIIPYLGNIVGLGTALPLALFQDGGGWLRVALVLAVFAVVQMVEGYVLTPKIMGDRTGLHPMVIIVAIFFWGTALSGILGMILAIPLTAFLVVFWRLAREKYVQELV